MYPGMLDIRAVASTHNVKYKYKYEYLISNYKYKYFVLKYKYNNYAAFSLQVFVFRSVE